MAGSSFGTILKVTTFGESHGPAVGAVLDGFPAGMELSSSDIQVYLDRRRPGKTKIATPRNEADSVEILSGVFDGKTTGTPIGLLIRNTSQHSGDYDNLRDCYRPGHADFGYDAKYGFRDYRGGGRSSGRETTGRVAAGAIAAKFLKELGIRIIGYTSAIGPVKVSSLPGDEGFDEEAVLTTATAMPDSAKDAEARAYLETCMKEKDSSGGEITVVIRGVPAGIGDPVFDKLDARLSAALMSIGAVKAVEIGDGKSVSGTVGSKNNDPFRIAPDGKVITSSNHAGGILGGISTGMDIILRASVKPTPSIFREQETVSREGTDTSLTIKGRHDPVIVPRAAVVAETMCALTILDSMLLNMSAKTENILKFYGRI